MNPRILAACLATLLLLIASSTYGAPPVFRVDDDSDCADPSRQAKIIVGGWAGFANQARMFLWLQMDPANDPTGSNIYMVDIVHQGTTVVAGQPVQFNPPCPSPDAQWRFAELVYGGFISGDKYTLVLRDSSGASVLGSDSVRFVNGPGI